MKKLILSTINSLLLSVCLFSQEIPFARQISSKYVDYPRQTKVDNDGNVVVLCSVTDTVYLDRNQVFSTPSDSPSYRHQIQLSKFTSSGALIWTHRIGTREGTGGSFTIDNNNNIIISGYVTEDYYDPLNTPDFDFSPDTARIPAGGFLVKYDEHANLIWLKGGQSNLPVGSLATDGDGNIYMTGRFHFRCDADFSPSDSLILVSHPRSSTEDNGDYFLAKYDSAANLIWANAAGSRGTDAGMRICIYGNNVLVAGLFSGMFDADPSPWEQKVATLLYWMYPYNSNSSLSSEPFIACYSATTGHLNWFNPVHMTAASTLVEVKGIATDQHGSVYLLANFRGSTNFDSLNTNANIQSISNPIPDWPGFSMPTYDLFLAKYSITGVFQWVHTMGAPGDEYVGDLSVLDDEHIFLSGAFESHVDNGVILPGFDTVQAYLDQLPDISNFITRLNGNGQPYWLYYVDNLQMSNVAAAQDGGIYVCGNFIQPVALNGVSHQYNLSSYRNSWDIAFFKLTDDISGSTPNFLVNQKMYTSTNGHLSTDFVVDVFPNPFSTQLTFSLAENKQTTISLYNFLGQQIVQQTCTNSTTINTEPLADGIYFYELGNDKGILKTGIVVKQ